MASLSSFRQRLTSLGEPEPSPTQESLAKTPSISSFQQRLSALGGDSLPPRDEPVKATLVPGEKQAALSQLISRGAPGEEAVRRTRPVDPSEFGETGTIPEHLQKPTGRQRDILEDAFSVTAGNLVRMGSGVMQLAASMDSIAKLPSSTVPGQSFGQLAAIPLQFLIKDKEKIAQQARDLWEFSKHEDFTPQNKDAVGKVFTLAASTVPYIAATTASTLAAGPLGGLAVGWMVEGNSSYQAALDFFEQDGIVTDEERNKAAMIGVGAGLISGAIEAAGGKVANKAVNSFIQKNVTSAVVRGGTKFGVDSLIEGGEELLQELTALTGESFYREIDLKEEIPRLLEAGASGVLVGGIFRGAGDVARGAQLAEDIIAGRAGTNEAFDFALENIGKLEGSEVRIGLKSWNDAEILALSDRAGTQPGAQRAAEVLEAEIERRGKAVRVKGEIAAEPIPAGADLIEAVPLSEGVPEGEVPIKAVVPPAKPPKPAPPATVAEPGVEAVAAEEAVPTVAAEVPVGARPKISFGKAITTDRGAIVDARKEVKAGDIVTGNVLDMARGVSVKHAGEAVRILKQAVDIITPEGEKLRLTSKIGVLGIEEAEAFKAALAQPAPAAKKEAAVTKEKVEQEFKIDRGVQVTGEIRPTTNKDFGDRWYVVRKDVATGKIFAESASPRFKTKKEAKAFLAKEVVVPKKEVAKPKPAKKPEAKRPAEQTTTPATPKIEADVAEAVEADPTDPKITSARQDKLKADNEALGRTGPMTKERQTFEEWQIKAREEGVHKRATLIANEVVNNPRALSPIESAGLIIRLTEVKNERQAVAESFDKLTDEAEIASAAAVLNSLESEQITLMDAMEFSSSERGRALVAQKFALDQDFDIVTLARRADVAGGKKISKDFRVKLEKLANALKAAEAEVAKLTSQNMEARAMKYLKAKITAKHLSRMTSAQKQANSDTLVAKLVQLTKDGCNF